MTTKQIKEAFDALYWVFDNKTYNYAQQLFDVCRSEEKGHRGILPDFARCHTSDTIGLADAARLFAVKRVAEYLLPKFTVDAGRQIRRNGEAFLSIGREGNCEPVEADRLTHEIASKLNQPSGKDYLHTQHSCFIAAGIADEFGDEVREAWAKFNLQELADLNYTDFVKVRKAA